VRWAVVIPNRKKRRSKEGNKKRYNREHGRQREIKELRKEKRTKRKVKKKGSKELEEDRTKYVEKIEIQSDMHWSERFKL
jgi:hypothetical protein